MFADGGHFTWRSGSLDIILKVNHLRTIHATFALNWLTGFRVNLFKTFSPQRPMLKLCLLTVAILDGGRVFFICLCSPSVFGENKQIENTSTWKYAVSIMQTFIQYIVHLVTLKIGFFCFFFVFLLKIGFNYIFFFFTDISSCILLTIQT